jgi:hypothetical protein
MQGDAAVKFQARHIEFSKSVLGPCRLCRLSDTSTDARCRVDASPTPSIRTGRGTKQETAVLIY